MKEFTYDWYSAFLRHCQSCGNVTLMRDVESGMPPQIVLRHDVDFDLTAALELSLVEERAGVRSTYLVLLTSHYYNPASPKGRGIIEGLVRRGFEVGLHFDPTVYGSSDAESLCAAFKSERSFLESIVGSEVRSVSVHNPSAHGLYPSFPGVVNAYDPRWFGTDRYVSDSLRRWKHDPFTLVSKAKDLGCVQVLCHPIHFAQEDSNYQSVLKRLGESWRTEAFDYIYERNQTFRDECSSSTLARHRNGDL